MRKLLVGAVLVLVASVGVGAASASGFFTDDDSSVHLRAIEAIADKGITKGCNPPVNDQFCPKASVTREQMATFLVRALGLPAGSSSFTDVGGSVHAADIGALAQAGITQGCNPPTNDRFCPKNPVTREQMATFLSRALKLDTSPRVVVISDLDAAGVPGGTSEAETVATLTSLFGAPTADTVAGCPYFLPNPNMRYVRWGSLIVAIKTVDSGNGELGLVGWRYKLDAGGQAEAGGPAAMHVELPFGLELGDEIGDAVAAGGGPITVKPNYGWMVVEFADFTFEATGAAVNSAAPIDGVQQGFGFDCE